MRQYIGAVRTGKNIYLPRCLLSKKLPINFTGLDGNRNNIFTGNDTFKMKITLDRHRPRPKPNHSHLPDPTRFSSLSTFIANF